MLRRLLPRSSAWETRGTIQDKEVRYLKMNFKPSPWKGKNGGQGSLQKNLWCLLWYQWSISNHTGEIWSFEVAWFQNLSSSAPVNSTVKLSGIGRIVWIFQICIMMKNFKVGKWPSTFEILSGSCKCIMWCLKPEYNQWLSIYLIEFVYFRCKIYFYLEDDSIQVIEPKVENSGIPQGMSKSYIVL